jgi:hypothetical protein
MMSSPPKPISVSGPGPPRRLSLRSLPRSVAPPRASVVFPTPLVGSSVLGCSMTCSQPVISPERRAWRLEMPPGAASGLT